MALITSKKGFKTFLGRNEVMTEDKMIPNVVCFIRQRTIILNTVSTVNIHSVENSLKNVSTITKVLSKYYWSILIKTLSSMPEIILDGLHYCLLALMDTKMLSNYSWTIPKELI